MGSSKFRSNLLYRFHSGRNVVIRIIFVFILFAGWTFIIRDTAIYCGHWCFFCRCCMQPSYIDTMLLTSAMALRTTHNNVSQNISQVACNVLGSLRDSQMFALVNINIFFFLTFFFDFPLSIGRKSFSTPTPSSSSSICTSTDMRRYITDFHYCLLWHICDNTIKREL